jgi:exonuclease III
MFKKSVRILSLNCSSLKDSGRLGELYRWMRTEDVDILLAQEVGIDEAQALKIEETYRTLGVEVCSVAGLRTGVSIFINKLTVSWDPVGDERRGHRVVADGNARLIACSVRYQGTPLVVASVYAPAQPDVRERWLKAITPYFTDHPPSRAIDIIGGDWNVTINRLDRTSGRLPTVADAEAQRNLRDALGYEGISFVDGWRVRHPQRIEYTHHNSNIGSTRIDRIYIRQDWMRWSSGWDILTPSLKTDHLAPVLELNLPSEIQRGPGRWRLNPTLLEFPPIREACTATIRDLIKDRNISLEKWVEAKRALAHEMADTSKRRRKAATSTARRLKKERCKLVKRRKYGTADPKLEIRLRALALKEKNLAKVRTRTYAYNAMAKQRLLGERPTKWFFNLARSKSQGNTVLALQNDESERITTNQGMCEIGVQFYGKLYEAKPSEKTARDFLLNAIQAVAPPELVQALKAPISGKEIKASIQRAATGKSPGLDGLVVELYKLLLSDRKEDEDHAPIVQLFERLFNEALNHPSRIPKDFTEACLSILWKGKGSPEDLSTYRPLTILNADYKLLTEILMRRLLRAFKHTIGPEQFAFIPGRLIDDNIRTVQAVIDTYRDQTDDGIYLLFLDQEKAYDRVSRRYLWKSLRKMGIPGKLIDCLQA